MEGAKGGERRSHNFTEELYLLFLPPRPGGELLFTPTIVAYIPNDPFAIHFHFPADANDPNNSETITWTFGRDLFKVAIEKGSAGVGDVKLTPVANKDHSRLAAECLDPKKYMIMNISSPAGEADYLIEKRKIKRIADRVFKAVSDEEASRLAIDAISAVDFGKVE